MLSSFEYALNTNGNSFFIPTENSIITPLFSTIDHKHLTKWTFELHLHLIQTYIFQVTKTLFLNGTLTILRVRMS